MQEIDGPSFITIASIHQLGLFDNIADRVSLLYFYRNIWKLVLLIKGVSSLITQSFFFLSLFLPQQLYDDKEVKEQGNNMLDRQCCSSRYEFRASAI